MIAYVSNAVRNTQRSLAKLSVIRPRFTDLTMAMIGIQSTQSILSVLSQPAIVLNVVSDRIFASFGSKNAPREVTLNVYEIFIDFAQIFWRGYRTA